MNNNKFNTVIKINYLISTVVDSMYLDSNFIDYLLQHKTYTFNSNGKFPMLIRL